MNVGSPRYGQMKAKVVAGWQNGSRTVMGWKGALAYLGAEDLQLGRSHTDQLHPFLVVGDGARQVGHLETTCAHTDTVCSTDRKPFHWTA